MSGACNILQKEEDIHKFHPTEPHLSGINLDFQEKKNSTSKEDGWWYLHYKCEEDLCSQFEYTDNKLRATNNMLVLH